MITDKKTLVEYLEADRKALGITQNKPHIFGQEIWKYQIALRKYEYYLNAGGAFSCMFGSSFITIWESGWVLPYHQTPAGKGCASTIMDASSLMNLPGLASIARSFLGS